MNRVVCPVLASVLILLFSPLVSAFGSRPVAAGDTWFTPCANGGSLLFSSDFEEGVDVTETNDGERANFSAMKGGKTCPAGAKSKDRSDLLLGRPDIQFQGGGGEERGARITEAPGSRDGHALQLWLSGANTFSKKHGTEKGRVQMNVYNNRNVRRLKMSVRMFLSDDFNIIRSYPGKVDWLTIAEWWNNAGWTGEDFPFRISVNIVKGVSGRYQPLLFKVHAQTLNTNTNRWDSDIWSNTNRFFEIPVGRWVTIEYGYIEGDSKNGRFYMTATPDGGHKTVVFDVANYTRHPLDNNPDGLSHFNPVKLYTSKQLIDYVRNQGGRISILWDDIDMAACDGASSCSFE